MLNVFVFTVSEYIESEELSKLYLDAVDIFDDPEIVSEFTKIGYIGAMYGGIGLDAPMIKRFF